LTDRPAHRATFRLYVFLVSFLILPNLPLLLAARSLNLLTSEYIDLDYIVVALLSLFLPRAATFLLLLLAVLGDFIHAACATYLFSPSEFISAVRFGLMLSTTRTAVIAGASALVLLICVLATLCVSRFAQAHARRRAAAVLLVMLAILPLIQTIANRGHVFGSDETSVSVIRIPSLRLVHGEWRYRRYDRGERLAGMRAMPSASAIALGHLHDFSSSGSAASTNDLPDFVQIIVESWGLPKDETLGHALLAPFADPQLRERYRVIEGTMPFEGPTTSGESRELCQTHSACNASHGSLEQMQHCLPDRLRSLGYRTLAVHGFNGEFFDRNVWYPQMGFRTSGSKIASMRWGCPNAMGRSLERAMTRWPPGSAIGFRGQRGRLSSFTGSR
jgi:hypothetical protein